MTSSDPIDLLVRRALDAPSADNLQPWELQRRADGFDVKLAPDRPHTLRDVGGVASGLACGALIESVTLAGAAIGQRVSWQLVPDSSLHVRITVTPMEAQRSELVDAIDARCTNRARFDKSPLQPELVAKLSGLHEDGALLELFSSKKDVAELSALIGISEELRAARREAHEDLQHALRWTPEDAERTRDGLDVRTLGLKRVELALLHFCKPWARMRVLLAIGGAMFQGRYARELAGSASAFAWIGVPRFDPASLIAAGRLMQRVWLTATAAGLEVSPFAALPLLGCMRAVDPGALDEEARARIDVALQREGTLRAGRPGSCALLLRLGRAPRPAVRTLRRKAAPNLLAPMGAP